MVPGIPNPYAIVPLNKMWMFEVKPDETDLSLATIMTKAHPVLYNPQTLKLSRTCIPDKQQEEAAKNADQLSSVKFSMLETLEMDLFLDGFNAGAEVLDVMVGKVRALAYAANSVLPSAGKIVPKACIQDEIDWILERASLDKDGHTQGAICFKWGSVTFAGIISAVTVQYLKFNELGKAMRASVHLVVMGKNMLNYKNKFSFLFSPDTSKFHTVTETETLNDISRIAYDGDPSHWREIARANDIVNPRVLRSGSVVHMPALVD